MTRRVWICGAHDRAQDDHRGYRKHAMPLNVQVDAAQATRLSKPLMGGVRAVSGDDDQQQCQRGDNDATTIRGHFEHLHPWTPGTVTDAGKENVRDEDLMASAGRRMRLREKVATSHGSSRTGHLVSRHARPLAHRGKSRTMARWQRRSP